MSGPNSYTAATKTQVPSKGVARQDADVPPEISHHNPYPEWAAGVFAKWSEKQTWRAERLVDQSPNQSEKEKEKNKAKEEAERQQQQHQQRLKNATDPEMIKRRREITNAFVAKATRNQCKTTDELIKKLNELQ